MHELRYKRLKGIISIILDECDDAYSHQMAFVVDEILDTVYRQLPDEEEKCQSTST